MPIVFSLLLLAACGDEGRDESAEVRHIVRATPSAGQELEAPQTLDERFAYVLGYQMSASMAANFSSIDTSYIALGASDYTDGVCLYSEQEMADIALQYQSQVFQQAEEMFNRLKEENLREAESFLSSNAERSTVVTLRDGIQYEILRQADPAGRSPQSGSHVTVDYQLVTLDGDVMDSSYDRSGGTQLSLSGTIEGFREVVLAMREGERVRAWVHPDYGYGQYGNGNIGPNQLLIFDIELVSVDD